MCGLQVTGGGVGLQDEAGRVTHAIELPQSALPGFGRRS